MPRIIRCDQSKFRKEHPWPSFPANSTPLNGITQRERRRFCPLWRHERKYKTMLFGCPGLHVYTDHKDLTFLSFQTQRVLRWRLFLGEFGPTFLIEKDIRTSRPMLSAGFPLLRTSTHLRTFLTLQREARSSPSLQMNQPCWTVLFTYQSNRTFRSRWILPPSQPLRIKILI